MCGNGQGLLRSLFHQNWFWDEILAILLLKLVATAAAFGSGVVGGVFTPTLFIGAAIGMLYGQTVLYLAPDLRSDPAMYGLVGMGSFIAATTGAPVMAILMAFELTLDYAIAALPDGELRRGLLLQRYFREALHVWRITRTKGCRLLQSTIGRG